MMTFDEFLDVQPTFEQIVKKYGNEEIYKGTNVDEATQQILEDFFFDYEIGSDEKTFLRYYRRKINELYDQYMAQLRTLAVIKNMDPYVQHYLEEKTLSGRTYDRTRTSEMEANGTGNTTGTTTPNLTTITKNTGTETTEGASGNTETIDTTTNTTESANGTSTNSSKNRSFGIIYPEANLNSISSDIDDMPSINYANSEQDALAKTTGTNTSSATSLTENGGTVKNEVTNNNTLTHNTQSEQTQSGNSQTSTQNSTTSKSNNSDAENGNDTSEFQRIEKGRSESVVDIIPRVISSIEMADATKYLIDKMSICFNTISI